MTSGDVTQLWARADHSRQPGPDASTRLTLSQSAGCWSRLPLTVKKENCPGRLSGGFTETSCLWSHHRNVLVNTWTRGEVSSASFPNVSLRLRQKSAVWKHDRVPLKRNTKVLRSKPFKNKVKGSRFDWLIDYYVLIIRVSECRRIDCKSVSKKSDQVIFRFVQF